MKKIIIAIDGYSSTGKSTLAKSLAKSLSYKYIDTGAMYRVVTLFAMRNGFVTNTKVNSSGLISNLNQIDISFKLNAQGKSEACLNAISVEKEIRGMDVSSFVSKISAIAEVRELLVAQQQLMGKAKGVVMDGRDIGSVVFPQAELKLFMTASEEVRVQRRLDELMYNGVEVSFDAVKKNLNERDYLDTNRAISPLIKTKDALVLDNSYMSRAEQLSWILERVSLKCL
jgi:CMP/dCMP kinase